MYAPFQPEADEPMAQAQYIVNTVLLVYVWKLNNVCALSARGWWAYGSSSIYS